MNAHFLPQPWLAAGLAFLLLPSAARVKELRTPDVADISEQTRMQKAAPPSAQPHQNIARSGPRSNTRPDARADVQPEELSGANEPLPLAPQEWPQAWQALLANRKWPPQPKVLWTYAGLGHDLAGQPLAERRNVVAALLQGLGHAPGTHVFWPYALPDSEANPAVMLRSGVELFQPRVLVVLGSEARDALNLPKIKPYQYALAFSRRLFMLPQPVSLHGRPDMVQSVLAYLSENLRFCGRANAGNG